MNFQMFQLVLEKAEEPAIKLPTSAGSSKKQERSRKKIYTTFWLFDIMTQTLIHIQKKYIKFLTGKIPECSNCCTIALISHTSKVTLKILQARLQQYVNHELPDVQAGFRKGRGTRDQIANIHWIIEKNKRLPEKHLFLLY